MFAGQYLKTGLEVAAACIAAGLLGSFRGGEILPTGRTTVTRVIYALLMAALVYTLTYTTLPLLAAGALAVSLYLALLINNSKYQQPGFDNYGNMYIYGFLRGVVISIGTCYWMGHNAFIMPIFLGLGQSLSYIVGWEVLNGKGPTWLRGGTQWAELLLGMTQFLVLYLFLAVFNA